jgi:hypothetical protein
MSHAVNRTNFAMSDAVSAIATFARRPIAKVQPLRAIGQRSRNSSLRAARANPSELLGRDHAAKILDLRHRATFEIAEITPKSAPGPDRA